MPQIMRAPFDNQAVTLNAVADVATAVVLAQGTSKCSITFESNAGRVSWDETDLAAMSTHDTPVPANSLFETTIPRRAHGAFERRAGYITITTNPADADKITIYDGTTTVVFEFETGGGVGVGSTQVNVGATSADTATNLATAISGSALNMEAQRDTRSTSRVNYITKAADLSLTFTHSAPAKTSNTDLGPDCPVIYVASGVGNTVVDIWCEGLA